MTRRLVRALLVAAFALIALTGCELTGTVNVRSAEAVDLDLTVKGDDYYLPCDSAGWGATGRPLGFNEFVDERGETTCRVYGTVHPELIRDYLQVSQPGEYLEAASNPLAMAPGRDVPIGSVWLSERTKLDVTVTFPGRVLTSTGVASGNVVHFGDPEQYVRPYGLRATALNHPGPEWSAVGPIVGVAAGIGLAALGIYLWGQRRRTTERAATDPPGAARSADEGRPDEPVPSAGDDPQGAPPQPAGPAADPTLGSGRPAADDDPLAGPQPLQSEPDPPPAEADDSRWAPPTA